MRVRRMMAMLAIPLASCAGVDGSGPTAPATVTNGPCSHDGLDRFVGQKASAALGADMLAASGANNLRWGGPGMAMTMDYRADRLTVSYDAQMVITSAKCG